MRKLKPFNPGPGPNSIAGTASTKLLYGSDMDDLTVMLRESVQNSWDARGDSKFINYTFTGLELSNIEIDNLRTCIGNDVYGSLVVDFIQREGKFALQITDIETEGLTGDITYDNNHSDLSRFLKFVFEVGNTQQGSGSGGSFGYGKASLYKVSQVGTVAIYTRVRVGLEFEERFIIKSINRFEDFKDNGSGVFWWGERVHKPENDACATSILPVTGMEAGELARSIGMQTLNGHETGTVLMVYAPFLGADAEASDVEMNGFPTGNEFDKLEDAVNIMQRTSVHYFWAKYPQNGRGIGFEFAVRSSEGIKKVMEDQNPATISPYNRLLASLSAAKRPVEQIGESENCKVITTNRPQINLGIVSWVEITEKEINPRYKPFFEPLRSQIALMRNVEFVVKYLDVYVDIPSGPDDMIKFVIGVFRTLEGAFVPRFSGDVRKMRLDDIYRASENQTHGEWSHNNVTDLGAWCSTYIKQTPDKITYELKQVYPDITRKYAEESVTPDAENMAFLGQFINGVQGGGRPGDNTLPGISGGRSGGDSGKPRPVIEYIRQDGIERNGDIIESRHVFKVKNPQLERPIRLFPVCPDEDGSMKLKDNVPVSLTDISVLDIPESRIRKYINKNGSVTIKSDVTEYTISVSTTALTDCRYAVDVELLEAN